MLKRVVLVICSIIIGCSLCSCSWIESLRNIEVSQTNNEDKYLLTSISPDGTYVLEAYRTEPGATVAFSIKVYIVNDDERRLIYNAYHENQANIIWIDNNLVSINEKRLDLSKNETYDWRK